VLRDAVIHLTGEQPLVADLASLPTANDSCLICTNLRTLDGKRPLFTDAIESTFVIPLLHVRFIEIVRGGHLVDPEQAAIGPGAPAAAPDEAPGELDEDFLRRVREA
jgi:hypothetical protein